MRSLSIYGQLAPLTRSRVARRLRRRMLLVDPLVVNVLAELHSSSSQKHMWPWRWPWEILFQIMHSRQFNIWQTNASKYWSWYFQLWKIQQLIAMVHPCLDYTLMDYTLMDYLWVDYKDSWTTPNWTTYDVWTTAVWTTNHLDYPPIGLPMTFGLPPFGLHPK